MPIETPSQMGLINAALRECLGETPASGSGDPRSSVQTLVAGFDRIYETLLQSNPWRFSMKKRALSLVNDTPVNEWKYIFQIPADCLMVRGVWPRRTPYEIFGDKLYTNARTLDLEYQFKPAVTALPAYFASLLIIQLGIAGARITAGKESIIDDLKQRQMPVMATAQYADAQARPNRRMDDPGYAGDR